jgi:hypothetical protein
MFAIAIQFHPMKNLLTRLEHTRVEPLTGLHSNGRLQALPENIRPGEVNGGGKHTSLFWYGKYKKK